ncbi:MULTISPECIES: hypothetical protein [Streptomyces]|uniref:DUF998 domain-containing protein n=1 Tax=Streptomyces rimosus subsp. rimosus TaxID=132474 RepID=A0ABY3YT73_STRRM|nr:MULTISPECIES: hypothetical protein [Streptomyces]KOG81031.1 hypothetical protein ADK78_04445 [Kitasatospora aureofaciens]KOT43794.1 hypothetical protein ADK42_07130 [Streptomyces rimosus subsp. rimosus]KOT44681.1 hypothetical protein ADK84_06095 [Streptomyces sp. NRRL WC-3701]KOT64707.1 hypothetical protein ADK44_08845 [Streptomyces rimosus subsp. rimosus]KOT66783.1 hypothetical protein ADK45_10590 [Streptomyces rimosus subsp. rimosus]
MHDVRETPHRWRSAFALVLLAPLVGEYLLGNTPISDLGALFLYLPLYGCAALLIREIARRTGRGWPTMLLLAAAYGLFEEGPVDQMLWNPHYGTADFGLVYAGTHVPLLGTSLSLLQDVVSMHMIWSICVPIALVEAFSRDPRRPWLGRPGMSVTVLVFAAGSLFLACLQYLYNDRFLASAWQWSTGTVMIVGLVVVAFHTGRGLRRPARAPAPAPGPWQVGGVAFLLTSAYWAGQSLLRDRVSDWLLVVLWSALAVAAVTAGSRWSRRRGWGSRHRVAVAVGALLTYVWLGFTHAADMGVPPAIGLAGNAVFGAGALVLAAVAIGAARRNLAEQPEIVPETAGAVPAPKDPPS